MFKHIVRSEWFALVDLAIVATVGYLLFITPQTGWWIILLTLIPWGMRVVSGQFPWQRTRLDGFLFVFLVTAIIGVWAAYDQQFAWTKFWVLLAAILLFYALAGQPEINLWPLAGVVSALGLLTVGIFLITRDWGASPEHLRALQRLGLQFVATLQVDRSLAIHPNVAASLMAMTLPFVIALIVRSWRERRWLLFILMLLFITPIAASLFMTGSRGAWASLCFVAVIWIFWLISGPLGKRIRLSKTTTFLILLFLSISSLILSVIQMNRLAPGGGVQTRLFGFDNRVALMGDTLRLLADFPFTGSGLGSFPGLYSQYILIKPSFFIGHGHNLFLNVMLEQGVLGSLALIGTLAISGWWLIAGMRASTPLADHQNLLHWAVLSSLMIMILHGMIDDPLYGQRGTPLLFVVAGLAVALKKSEAKLIRQQAQLTKSGRWLRWRRLAVMVSVVLILLVYSNWRLVSAGWYANMGAVEMARVELADWPTNRWDEGRRVDALKPAGGLFERALVLDGKNQTAHYRLGLIAMVQRDYEAAVTHLSAAYHQDEQHQGIVKSLGYSYAWTGDLERAATLLSEIPEARAEMKAYVWWWGNHGRDDLAQQAQQMLLRLESPVTALET